MLRRLGFAGQDQADRRVRVCKRGLTSSQLPGDIAQAATAPLPHPTARRTRSRERPGSGASISVAALLRRWSRGEKVKSCRLLILKGLGFPREPIMAAVILVHSWPPVHGCCLQAGAQLLSLAPGAPRGDGLPTCHSGGHHAPRDLGHHELPVERQRRAPALSPPAPAGALMGVYQGEPGGQEKRRDGEVAAQSLHRAAHVGEALSSLHSCSQTPLNCNPRAEASPLPGLTSPLSSPKHSPGGHQASHYESPPAPVPAGGPPREAETLQHEVPRY